jgi:NADH:ubiquinone oxidoreductase subunit E
MFSLSRSAFKLQSSTLASVQQTTMAAASKLNALRELMKINNLAAYYVPSEDAHQVAKYLKIILPSFYRVNTFLKETEDVLLLAISPVLQVQQ